MSHTASRTNEERGGFELRYTVREGLGVEMVGVGRAAIEAAGRVLQTTGRSRTALLFCTLEIVI